MEIFKVSLEEISLSGLEGCTLEELWKHLSNRQPAISFSLDEPTKSYIWSQLLSSIKPKAESCPVRFYQLPNPRAPAVSPATPPTPFDYHHPFNYRFISDSTASSNIIVRGSCITYHERKDVTPELSNETPSLASVAEKYGNSLVLVASQEFRERILVPEGTDPCLEVTDVQYGLLEVVGCARHRGISRPFVTSKYLKVDARSTFFYTKQLEKKGLIVLKNLDRSFTGGRAGALSVLFLSAYRSVADKFVYYGNRKEQLCAILNQSPYQCKPVKELYAEMGKKIKPCKKDLLENGYIEYVQMKDVAEEYANDPAMANLKGCRLVKPYDAKETEAGGDADEDDEDGGGDSSSKTPTVAELPLEMQGYRFIDNCGSAGIPQEEFISRTGLDLSRFTNRGIVRNLIRKSKVVAITHDSAPVRTISLVAADHAKKNKDYQRLEAEVLKSGMGNEELPVLTGPAYFPPEMNRIRKDRKSKIKVEKSEEAPIIEPSNEMPEMISVTDSLLAELSVATPNLNESRSREERSVSMTPEGRSVSPASLLGPEPKSRHHAVQTFKQLKRARVIMEFFKEHRVVSSLVTLGKHLRNEEFREGQEHVLDNKTLRNAINRLVSENKLGSRQVTLSIEESTDSDDPATQRTTLYYIPEVTEQEIAMAQEAALAAFKSIVCRRALRTKGKRTKKGKGDSQSEEESQDDELVNIPDTGGMSRFQRLRHLHCYLWILAYGHYSDSAPSNSAHSREHVLPKAIFPWACAVSKLPTSSKGPGWLNFFDITNNIPLSLYLILARIMLGKIPSRYLNYFHDEKYMNTSLISLPDALKKGVIFKNVTRRDRTVVYNLLELLEELQLITLHGTYSPRDRSQLIVKLANSASILDTSICKPRRSFFLNEARSEFTELPFTLSCLADVERYWFDLQLMCQQTPIILGERKLKNQTADPTHQDTHPLVYRASAHYPNLKRSDKEWMEAFNQRGFGAGGLPPLMFSHSSRNWCAHSSVPAASSATPTPLPGTSLIDFPFTSMDDVEPTDGGYPNRGMVEGEEIPLAKRMRLSKGIRVTVPASQVIRNDGGRGREREKMKKMSRAVKAARKVISSKVISTHRRFRLFDEISKVIEDDTLKPLKSRDKRVSIAGPDKGKERANWTPEQGDYLLSCYLACCLLHERGGSRVTYSQIKEAILERFPRTRCKISAVKRYLSALLRKSPQVRSTMEVRITECLREMEAMGTLSPAPTFSDMLTYLNNRSDGPKNILPEELLLPRTLQELHENHTIIGGSKKMGSHVMSAVQGEHEINQALLTDLIIATLGADESTYDQYKAFKLFESFPERDVMAALERLKHLQLIKRKKPKMTGIPVKQSPLETQTYDINHNFFAKLEGHFPPNLLQDTASLFAVLLKGQSSLDPTHPGVGWDEGRLSVHGERAKATTAAALLGATSLGVMEEVRPVLPEPLFEELGNPDQPDDEELMDTSAQLLGEEDGDAGSDGDDKEEEEEAKEEAGLTREIMRKLKYATGGVSTLFGVGAGPMKHGHVEVELALSRDGLFEPAQNEQNSRSSETEEKMKDLQTVSESSQQTQSTHVNRMTLDDYLIIAKEHLKFDGQDLTFSQKLYQVIDESGSNAVQRSSLESHLALSHLPRSHSLDFHVQSLLNFDLIFVVGVSEQRLVTWAHSSRWRMSVDDLHTFTRYRPWSALTPPHLHTPLLEKYQHGVLMHIMAHPGISLVGLMNHFSPTLHLTGMREILQVLELSNQVKCYRLRAQKQCGLFENSDDTPEYTKYYEAVTNDFL